MMTIRATLVFSLLNSFRFNSSNINKNVKLMKAQYSFIWQGASAFIKKNNYTVPC